MLYPSPQTMKARILPSVVLALATSAASAQAVTYMLNDGFETGNFSGFPMVNFEGGNQGTCVSTEVNGGDYAFRSSVSYANSLAGGYHCEVGRYALRPERERWWGFAVFIPTDWVNDPNNCVLMQGHQLPDPGEPDRAPSLVMRVENDQLIIESRWDDNAISAPAAYGLGGTIRNHTVYTGPLQKGVWMQFVFHANFDCTESGDGLLEIWRDGVKIVTHEGPNCYNDQNNGTIRVGLYKRNYAANNQTSPVVAFYDQIKMTDQTGSYADVAPYARYINAGQLVTLGQWQADNAFSGQNETNVNGGLTFDLSGVTRPAPHAVYTSQRLKDFTYTFTGLVPGMEYHLDLHFAEFYQNTVGGRLFDVVVSGQTVLDNYDVFVAAGGQRIVRVEKFTVPADANGTIQINFVTEKLKAQVCALHLFN